MAARALPRYYRILSRYCAILNRRSITHFYTLSFTSLKFVHCTGVRHAAKLLTFLPKKTLNGKSTNCLDTQLDPIRLMIYKTTYVRHCQTVSKAETRVILCVVNLHFADRQFDLCRSTQIGIFRVDQHFDVADQRSPAHTLCPILWKINAPGEDPGSALKHSPSDFSPLFIKIYLVVRPPKVRFRKCYLHNAELSES